MDIRLLLAILFCPEAFGNQKMIDSDGWMWLQARGERMKPWCRWTDRYLRYGLGPDYLLAWTCKNVLVKIIVQFNYSGLFWRGSGKNCYIGKITRKDNCHQWPSQHICLIFGAHISSAESLWLWRPRLAPELPTEAKPLCQQAMPPHQVLLQQLWYRNRSTYGTHWNSVKAVRENAGFAGIEHMKHGMYP